MRATLALAALLPMVAARWCQLEGVKTDPDRDFSFSGPWRLDGCTTLELDHGKCDEEDCPHRVGLVDEEIIELADALREVSDQRLRFLRRGFPRPPTAATQMH